MCAFRAHLNIPRCVHSHASKFPSSEEQPKHSSLTMLKYIYCYCSPFTAEQTQTLSAGFINILNYKAGIGYRVPPFIILFPWGLSATSESQHTEQHRNKSPSESFLNITAVAPH